jgi:hypothetical protein
MFYCDSLTPEMGSSILLVLAALDPTDALIRLGQIMTQLDLRECLRFPSSKPLMCSSQWAGATIVTPR